MDIYLVTWINTNLLQKNGGEKSFLVRGAFDLNDAISKVKKQISPNWIGSPGESTFKVKRLTFNEYDTCNI